jgi:integrase
MASLERRGNKFRLVFRYAGRKFQHPLRTGSEREATACLERVEENIRLLERGRLALPPDADLPTFLLSDGKLNGPPVPRARLTLADFRDRYLDAHSQGSLEAKTLQTLRTHFAHLVVSFTQGFDVQALSLNDLQGHVNRRAKCGGIYKRTLSPVTTKKEMATFRAAWNWAVQAGLLAGAFPNRGLRFPKTGEKPPFRTFAEVLELVGREGMTDHDRRDLWDCVFLTREEVAELLAHVQANPHHPAVPPMFAFAAMTGARRSEILRLRWHDLDFASGTAVLQEMKRSKGKRTTRRVALADPLVTRLRAWQEASGGRLLVFPDGLGETAFGANEAHILFRRAVTGTKWKHLRGWHVFRHSFISNCAAAGVDQRMIDEWVGHTTEAMRRRYRHLIPGQQQEAMRLVFG